MPQVTPIRGFTNTPVTKSICVVSTVLALLLLVLLWKQYAALAVDPYILRYSQYWRVATFQLGLVNELDYLLCVLLWFHFKVLERFFGSRKYLLLVAVLALYNAAVTFVVLAALQLLVCVLRAALAAAATGSALSVAYTPTVFNLVAPGPFGLVSLLYVCYGAYVPVTYHFRILLRKPADDAAPADTVLLPLTNHFHIHILYTLFMLNNGWRSVLPCLVGLALGRLYTRDLLAGTKNSALPLAVYAFFVSPLVRKLSLRHAPTPAHARTDDDAVEPLDEMHARERSETPVRPLGRQLLDTLTT